MPSRTNNNDNAPALSCRPPTLSSRDTTRLPRDTTRFPSPLLPMADLRGPGLLPLSLPVPVARGSLQKGQGAMLVCSLLASLRKGRAHLLCVSPSRRSRASLPSLGILAPGFALICPLCLLCARAVQVWAASSLRKGRANLGCIHECPSNTLYVQG